MSDLRDTVANRRAQQTNQDLVDDERSEQIRILGPGHQVEQARHRVDDVVGRASDIQPAIVRRLGDATRVDPRGELSHPRGIQIEHEAEIRILPTGASHLAGDRQIHGEDEQVRGIVFEHFTAKHHDLGALRRDAQGGAQRGVAGLGRHPREAHGIGAREPKLKRPVVRGVRRESDWRVVAAPMRRALRASCPRRVAAADLANPSARRSGRDCSLCVFRRRRVYRRACREGVVIRAMLQAASTATFAETSDSNALSRSIRGGIGKESLTRPGTLIA